MTQEFYKVIALLCVVTGVSGSISCLPFALCSDLKWIAAAGIYLIAGAVMITGGLIAYAIQARAAK